MEANIDHESKLAWMTNNWTLSFWLSAIYLLLVYTGRKWMRARQDFRLQGVLFGWNLALATFSVAGMCSTLPEMVSTLRRFGFQHSVCDASFFSGNFGLWTWLFALSKLPELGDTIFLVLRKRPLHFLHWYHHVTVLCYCWYSYGDRASTGRWFVAMNFAVHTLMYSYYALKALRVPVPNLVSVVITALQLMQMAVGCIINTWAYRAKAFGQPCGVTNENLLVSMLMYGSYLTLFARLFYNSYLVKRPRMQKTE